MTPTQKLAGLWMLVGCLFVIERPARGQEPSQASPRLSTPALKYFGRGRYTQFARPQSRRQAPLTSTPQLVGGKPFQNINRGQTISPYLSLDTIQTSEGVPNYYSRVLPKIQQQRANQTQAAELRQLQQQVRTASYSGMISNNRNGGVPTTGHSSQFLNNGRYFPGLRR